jgi:hypothetical protein
MRQHRRIRGGATKQQQKFHLTCLRTCFLSLNPVRGCRCPVVCLKGNLHVLWPVPCTNRFDGCRQQISMSISSMLMSLRKAAFTALPYLGMVSFGWNGVLGIVREVSLLKGVACAMAKALASARKTMANQHERLLLAVIES